MKTKKLFISVIFTALILTLFLIPISALDGEPISVSADYSSLQYQGQKYIRVDSSDILYITSTDHSSSVTVDGADRLIEQAEAYINDSVIELSVIYKEGGSALYYYINEALLGEYLAFIAGDAVDYEIGLYYGDIQTVKSQLFGKPVEFSGYELNYFTYTGGVSALAFGGDIYSSTGYIINDTQGNFYYVDHSLSAPGALGDITMQESVTVWQIVDEDIIDEMIKNTQGDFFDDGFNDLEFEGGDGFIFGIIFVAAILGIIPFVAAVVTFCISLKCSADYRRRLRLISALCLSAAVVTVITIIVCLAAAV